VNRAVSLKTVLKELSKYMLDSVALQKVRREGGGTEPAGELGLSMEREMRIVSAVNRVEFVSDRN
jgi:hypothetical protein